MKILVIGSGGREHALVWKIAQSKLVTKIFCAPGNGGISQQAERVSIEANDIPRLLEFALREKIDLTVVGPEVALVAGITDEFNKHGLKVFGPNKAAAQLEASKIFAKQMMIRYGIPTADFRVFSDFQEAKKYIELKNIPCVVKADGLAQGKGVVVAKTNDEAIQAAEDMLEKKVFGDAGNKIIIEECLQGEEASILVITDSRTIIPLASSQDHKRIFDYDQGLNTGGMGAYSPAPVVIAQIHDAVMENIVKKIIAGLAQEKIEYKGVLYAGVMITKDGPKALEFNVRFGDPETQAIIPRLKSDLVEIMLKVSESKLSYYQDFSWDNRACVCIVCAAKGYPGEYKKGNQISGLDAAASLPDVVTFHAGTKKDGKKFITNGGRVLGVTALGGTIKEAIAKAYAAVSKINFTGMQYRKDIGRKAVDSS